MTSHHYVEIIDMHTRQVEIRGPFSSGLAHEKRAALEQPDKSARVVIHASDCAVLDPDAVPRICDCGERVK